MTGIVTRRPAQDGYSRTRHWPGSHPSSCSPDVTGIKLHDTSAAGEHSVSHTQLNRSAWQTSGGERCLLSSPVSALESLSPSSEPASAEQIPPLTCLTPSGAEGLGDASASAPGGCKQSREQVLRWQHSNFLRHLLFSQDSHGAVGHWLPCTDTLGIEEPESPSHSPRKSAQTLLPPKHA